jgi:pectin methylesterase-like acyl-CoA thioesterase
MNNLRLTLIAIATLALAACANSETANDAGTSGSGGVSATGGTSAQGDGGSNGSGGSVGTGGGNASGGSLGTGGSIGSGGAGDGGTGTGTGGARATGGASGATGGTSGATGGASGLAGAGGKGGATGTGGTPTGTGGSAATGGTTGTGGTTATGGTTGTGNAPGNASSVYPPVNGTNVCPDPQLRITFSAAPSIGTSGLIQVFNSSGTAVASVDVGASTFSTTNGGITFNYQRPVYVDGNTVVVYLPSKPLTYNQTYYVNVASGAIKSSSGAAFVVTGSSAWRFSTAAAAPTNKSAVGVALDGSAPFCSLQGALDFIPASNTAAVTVSVANGTYHEIVYFKSKSNVTIQGASESGTIIEGTNNNNLNPSTKGRALFGADGTNGLTINNLTVYNQTPQGGSQAEALRLETCDKCVVTNSTIVSYQDTLLWDGRIYAKNDLIEGNVDYVWGGGVVYFDSCEIRTINRSGGVIVQARNAAGAYGYVFVNCKLTSDSASTGIALARIDLTAYPGSMVAYVNCQMTSNIAPVGWTITAGTDASQLRFWEYQSVTPSGSPVDVSKRYAGSMQISASEAATLSSPSTVLSGWQPPGT